MIQIVREKSNNNIIRRKKIKLKKNTRFKGSNISEDKYKYMEGYNFLFFSFFVAIVRMEETARRGSMAEWFGKYDDDGALKFRVRKARKKNGYFSFPFQLSRLSAGTNRKITVRNNWFNAFYFPPRACSWWKSIGNIIVLKKNIPSSSPHFSIIFPF